MNRRIAVTERKTMLADPPFSGGRGWLLSLRYKWALP